jgi:uncharacterized membrane protein YcaP (DUF421 family)
MDTQELMMTALRAAGIYMLMLVVIRLLGKRSVGAFSAFDLLVALMLGEVVDEIIYGDVSFLQGMVAIGVIAIADFATSLLSLSSPKLERVLEGSPTVIIRGGELDKKGLATERMNEVEVWSHLRMQGIEDVREVKLAAVEPSGQISVIKQDWAETVQKGDLDGPEAKEKEQMTGGADEPPVHKLTISPKALGEAA